MKSVVRVVLCAAVWPAALFGGAAVAAPSVTDWNGVYAGFHVGAAASAVRVDYSDGTYWNGLGLAGGEIGGFIGFNVQTSARWLVGLEGDASWLGLHNIDYDGTRIAFVNWTAAIDGRLGFLATPSTLVYGKAGWGLIGVDIPSESYVAAGTGARTLDAIQAGVGIETAFAQDWRLRVEASYTRATEKYTTYDMVYSFGADLTPDVLAARVGLVKTFGGAKATTEPAAMPDALSWSGAYFGAGAGWAISDTREEYLAGPLMGAAWNGFGGSSPTFGAFVGVNKQISPSLVLGLELGGSWQKLVNYSDYEGLLWGRSDWMASLDLRAGVVLTPGTLLYAKAGGALIDFRSNYPNFFTTGEEFHVALGGAQLGAGIETRLSPHWTARVEGLYTVALKGLEFDDTPPSQNHSFEPQIVSGNVAVAFHY